MKLFFYSTVLFLAVAATTYSQTAKKQSKITASMNTGKITNPTVKKAIDALQTGDKNSWFALFTSDALLFDDGHKMDFKKFFEAALGHERFTTIDKVEDNSLSLYGKFHSDRWGDFKTYFKFQLNADGKIIRLDIGQANY